MKENIEEVIEFLQGFNDGYTFQQCQTCFKFNEKDSCCNKEKCEELQAIEALISDYKRVLKENEKLKKMLDERFIYVTGARTVYGRLMQLDKEIIVKDDLKLRNEINQLLKENEELKSSNEKLERANKCYINSIHSIVPVLNQDYIEKQKIKDKIEELNKKIASEENEKVILWLHKQRNILQDLLEEKGE